MMMVMVMVMVMVMMMVDDHPLGWHRVLLLGWRRVLIVLRKGRDGEAERLNQVEGLAVQVFRRSESGGTP
jgi:hypothetical protein